MKSFKVILLTFVAAIFAGMVAAQEPAPAAVDQAAVATKFNEAGALVNAKEYAKAIPVLKEVISMGLEVPEAADLVQQAQQLVPTCHYSIGMAAARGQKLDEAEKEFTNAIESGELYNNLEVADKARAMLGRVYSIQASSAFNAKDYAKAIEIYGKGYAANPKDTDTALKLAMSYCESGDLDNGLKIYGDVIALAETHSKYADAATEAKNKASYYVMLQAVEAAKNKDDEKVFALTDKVLALDPASPEANMLRLQTANNAKDYAKVISIGDAAADAQTDPALKSSAYFMLGAAYQNVDNKAKAIDTYRKVVAGPNVATAKAQIAALSK